MKFRDCKNFFNDILEPLFYDTLATDRGHDAWCSIFKCRIPFLNGGLFEPVAGYDWKKTDITIPNSLFSNSKKTEAGDNGTGILDVFTHVADDVRSRLRKRITPNLFRSFYGKRLVRAAGVEPTTFGSGGRRSIQLSYARKATSKIPARMALLKWNLR